MAGFDGKGAPGIIGLRSAEEEESMTGGGAVRFNGNGAEEDIPWGAVITEVPEFPGGTWNDGAVGIRKVAGLKLWDEDTAIAELDVAWEGCEKDWETDGSDGNKPVSSVISTDEFCH